GPGCWGSIISGGGCSGRRVHSRIDTAAIESHAYNNYTNKSNSQINNISVTGVTSEMRFCQSNVGAGYDCHAFSAIKDAHLANPEDSNTSHPWHRVMQGACTSNCTVITDDTRGQT